MAGAKGGVSGRRGPRGGRCGGGRGGPLSAAPDPHSGGNLVAGAFLATVAAESGAVRIYLQPQTNVVAQTWSQVPPGLIEPASAIPEAVLGAAGYPVDWFRVQAQQLQRPPWKVGTVNARPGQ